MTASLRDKVYDKAVAITLRIYESWVIPPQKRSLKDVKLQEFRDRKKLLNPYTKDAALQQSEHLRNIAPRVKFQNMFTFVHTYDRHLNQYPARTKDFPSSYEYYESPLNWGYDPDWSVKIQPLRINFKKIFAFFLLGAIYLRYRIKKVEAFDQRKRREQRAMQNKEVEEFQGRNVKFRLKDAHGNLFTEKDIGQHEYVVLWYDAKLKNYLSFLEFIEKKKFIQAKIKVILVVDKEEVLFNMQRLQADASQKTAKEAIIMLRSDFTENEKLVESFKGVEDDAGYLDMKKNFYYVVDVGGRVIDCAKIYSFLHEDNIFKRVLAKVSKDIDERIQGKS